MRQATHSRRCGDRRRNPPLQISVGQQLWGFRLVRLGLGWGIVWVGVSASR